MKYEVTISYPGPSHSKGHEKGFNNLDEAIAYAIESAKTLGLPLTAGHFCHVRSKFSSAVSYGHRDCAVILETAE